MEAPLGNKEDARARLQFLSVEEEAPRAVTPLEAIMSRYQDEVPIAPRPRKEPGVFVGERGGADELEDLLALSLKEARKLIETEWNYEDPRFVTAKSGMIQSIFSTATKVDDTQLRRRQIDMLPKLLELIAVEEKKLPPLIEATKE